MKRPYRITAAILAALMLSSASVATNAAEAEPKEIDGVMTAFVSSFGKMSYGGASHVSYKTLEEGVAALPDG